MYQKKIQYYSCKKAIPVLLKFRLSLLKYLLQKKKYPLFTIKASNGGIIKTYEMQKKLKMNKFVKHTGHYYFSLTFPHWPSDAFDNMVSNGGLNITASGTSFKKQIDTLILGLTSRCKYNCVHCYEHFNLNDNYEVPVARWKGVIKKFQKSGVSVITFSGGEPMMRYDGLLELLETADHSLSDFHIHTSGYGVTPENASELKMAGLNAAGIGLDDVDPERNDTFRGYKGAHEQAVRAIRCFQDAGIFTYVNFCPTREIIGSRDILKYLDFMKDLNVGIVRWLEPRPCGNFMEASGSNLVSQDDKEFMTQLYIKCNTSAEYKDYPLISYEAFSEAPDNMGCMMGGNSLLYIDTVGNVEPCVFLPVTFGNIMEEDLSIILDRMKKVVPKPLHITCPSILLNPAIKSKIASGIKPPVPYNELTIEFKELVANSW
jgi:MoaA/NifB/PqqE/SkfB family radical SAM enzyme